MPRVICTLHNASNLINGVVFAPHKLGVISEEVEQDVADAFLAITGYLSYDEVKASALAAAAASAAAPIVGDAAAEPDTADVVATKKPTAQGKK